MSKYLKIYGDEPEAQIEAIGKIRALNDKYTAETGRKRKYFILTTGCQMNAHDSEKLSFMLSDMGYEHTDVETEADFILYNTCCVRENAEDKIYGRLGYLKHYKEMNKDIKIALCGCMMQQETVLDKIKRSFKNVDIVFGTFNIYKLPSLMLTNIESGDTIFDIWQYHKEIVEDMPAIRNHKYKASVNIMYGCNNFCSYCIVPYVRGRERSRDPEDIINEVKKLAAEDVKEVVLLGQNVNSYGKTLDTPMNFAELLRKINEIDGIERIRFMTSHPKDLSDELIETMKDCKKICKYLHLPLQSGSTDILNKMNRHYTKEGYLEIVRKLRDAMPNILISTDIIVGFPGESEEDFLETLDVVDKVGFCTAFTFLYSKRTGTPAATMNNQIDEETAKERFGRLLEHVNAGVNKISESLVGTTEMVLVEEVNKQSGDMLTGRTERNSLVHFEGPKELIGQVIPVKIIQNKIFYLIGERMK
ncbi:tRNA-2-methylthio-N(6)-dimethylallyladenosine synthase [Clostridiales bacterium]|nr:tRNA-2-methylthio-N(6)-dimethylallyladenosine synthase [Clostridiales bacterium]